MKKSIIYLGIILVAFTNVSHASKTFEEKANAFHQTSIKGIATVKDEALLTDKVLFEQKSFGPDEEVIFDPRNVISLNLEKPIEEIIAENNQIIESTLSNEMVFLYVEKPIEDVIAENNQIIEATIATEVHLIYLDNTIENVIAEDNKIIESNLTNEIQPLDFKE